MGQARRLGEAVLCAAVECQPDGIIQRDQMPDADIDRPDAAARAYDTADFTNAAPRMMGAFRARRPWPAAGLSWALEVID